VRFAARVLRSLGPLAFVSRNCPLLAALRSILAGATSVATGLVGEARRD